MLLARVRDEQGRLDLLVNNAWGGYERYDGASFGAGHLAGEYGFTDSEGRRIPPFRIPDEQLMD